ncbi:hypothetical protein TREES_T100003766 [Tupaia chinensis]|uniref:Uncharacterized protein n=1 Tax=Tupaia chinensis TaxID=246437 RepID=L9LBH9_TUPCH|nr:hypothetical protein TREES_T100003766 [Tupaia chinensis]
MWLPRMEPNGLVDVEDEKGRDGLCSMGESSGASAAKPWEPEMCSPLGAYPREDRVTCGSHGAELEGRMDVEDEEGKRRVSGITSSEALPDTPVPHPDGWMPGSAGRLLWGHYEGPCT